MQKLLLTIMLSFFATTMVMAQVSSQDSYSKEDLQQMYVNYLKREGYAPEVDGDGDILFKKEGNTYFIIVDENDLEFFRIILPKIWEIETEEEYLRVLLACDAATGKTKVAKAHTLRNNVWIASEIFVGHPSDFEDVFPRCMSAISTCKSKYLEAMRSSDDD